MLSRSIFPITVLLFLLGTAATAFNDLEQVKDVECPNKQAHCLMGQTCCRIEKTNLYSCCPLADAICCQSGVHCCPGGYTCQNTTNQCTIKQQYGRSALFLTETIPRIVTMPSSVGIQKHLAEDLLKKMDMDKSHLVDEKAQNGSLKCKDGSECPTGNTCCNVSKTAYGCCALPNAVCCNDFIHCCPRNYVCELKTKRCIGRGSQDTVLMNQTPYLTKLYDMKQKLKKDVHEKLKMSQERNKGLFQKIIIKSRTLQRSQGEGLSIMCPDHKVMCADNTKCCKMSPSAWGCCPFANGTCCADEKHCCPDGYQCQKSVCVKKNSFIHWIPLNFVLEKKEHFP